MQLSGEVFNVLNFDNVTLLSQPVLPENPAFVYGPGILPSGQVTPASPQFLQLRDASGQYNSAVAGQQGTPLQAQIGLRFLF